VHVTNNGQRKRVFGKEKTGPLKESGVEVK